MSESARDRILFTMHSALKQKAPVPVEPMAFPLKHWSHEERLQVLKQNLESVRSEVHIATAQTWTTTLVDILRTKRIKTLLYSPQVTIGTEIKSALEKQSEPVPELVEFKGSIEEFKDQMFEIDAAITSSRGAIAENGAIILWPDQNEPRLMSLVPPIHIVVLESSKIIGTFAEALESGKWTEGMPTNVVLTSGPSKTADIELVLAFGVHGPKELVVIIID